MATSIFNLNHKLIHMLINIQIGNHKTIV